MGVIGAWIKVLVGIFVLGACFIFTQPLFDFLISIGVAMGGNAQHTAEVIQGELRYLPVLMSLGLILWGFIEASSTENGSLWR